MRKKLYLLLLILIISACKETPRDYNYLVTHPKTLEKEYNRCQADSFATEECLLIRKAARDFTDLVNEHNQDAQAFGKKILSAQTKLVVTKQAMEKATGENKFKLEQDYQEQLQNVNEMLAVVAVMTGLE